MPVPRCTVGVVTVSGGDKRVAETASFSIAAGSGIEIVQVFGEIVFVAIFVFVIVVIVFAAGDERAVVAILLPVLGIFDVTFIARLGNLYIGCRRKLPDQGFDFRAQTGRHLGDQCRRIAFGQDGAVLAGADEGRLPISVDRHMIGLSVIAFDLDD